ncbi:hypothetical protein CIL03_02840 [Virgibacillus indicus]|uniref:Pilus assembly protein PilZ n=1 Tax=Virgibacillus indicus TaxID=2024554 RepID=A0A265NDL7_9BACI|nr:flagellar brake domain-containing protein [Virgibacillus indicus]OZU90093.1 hypothetical protein CIL03_02840 [Virgibacillus indicus]
MKIGTLLNLEVKDTVTKAAIKYRSKVIEKNEHYLFIDYPVNEKTRKTAFLAKGTLLMVVFAGDDQAIYQFPSKITAKVKLNVPALAIKLPDKSKLKRIQRREFVRINAAVDAAIYSPKSDFLPFVTVTSDISGGGMSVIVPKGNTLQIGQTIDVWLSLPTHSKKQKYVYSQAEIVFIKEASSSAVTASLKFVSISRQNQQHIISFCFQKQRELRMKELS